MDVLQGNYYNKKQDKKSGKKLEQKKGSIKRGNSNKNSNFPEVHRKIFEYMLIRPEIFLVRI